MAADSMTLAGVRAEKLLLDKQKLEWRLFVQLASGPE